MSHKRTSRKVLSISLLGGMVVLYGGQEVRLNQRKTQGILAFLALEGSCSRDMLVGRFWSDVAEDKARISLRQSIYLLKREFDEIGYRGLSAEKLTVELDRRNVEVDVNSILERAESKGQAHSLLLSSHRLSETLLAGLDDLDPSFQDWLRAKRQILHERLLRALESGLRPQNLGEQARSDFAQAILNLDPTHEEACRSLMRIRAELGDISGALRVYKSLWDLLGADYDMEPSAATQQLVAEIKMGAIERSSAPPRPAAARPTPTQPAKIALALDSFRVDGVSPELIHLVHGFRHHLVSSLVRFREWFITDRSTQRGAASAIPAASSNYDIQATAFQTKSTVQLVLTLKESESAVFIWTSTFELALQRWFETQQDVVRRIATALNVHISQERLNRLSNQPDVSLDAYDRWLRGQAVITGFRSDKWKSAEDLFRQTLSDAPNFSSAYSSLAQINNLMHITQPGVYRSSAREKETLELGRVAVRLDPLDSRAHLALGWAYMMSKQYEQAPTHFDLACQLNDSDPWTLMSASLAHAFSGSFPESKKLARIAFDLTLVPTPTMWGYEVTSRFLSGDYEGCTKARGMAGDVIINLPAWTAAALWHLGRQRQAEAEADRFIELARRNWQGQQAAAEVALVDWVLHCFPISRRADWERLRDGLQGAGLPIGKADHHRW